VSAPLQDARAADYREAMQLKLRDQALQRAGDGCTTCLFEHWVWHRHDDGSWRAPANDGMPHIVWRSGSLWRCNCRCGEFTRRDREPQCKHVAVVKWLLDAGVSVAEPSQEEIDRARILYRPFVPREAGEGRGIVEEITVGGKKLRSSEYELLDGDEI
jgi:hypothetical protein